MPLEPQNEEEALAHAQAIELGLLPGPGPDNMLPPPQFWVAPASFVTPYEASLILLTSLGVWAAIGIGAYFPSAAWIAGAGPGSTLATVEAEIAAGGILYEGTVYYGLSQGQMVVLRLLITGQLDSVAAQGILNAVVGSWEVGAVAGLNTGALAGANIVGGGLGGAGVMALIELMGWNVGGQVETYNDRWFDHNYGIIPGNGGWWYYDADEHGGGQWRWFQSQH